ncbi:hypothetical protein N0V92_003970 [Colletotrichum tropicale]|nr:hypothetical protein N0V92_003970 [Colletotrichum tropicale]
MEITERTSYASQAEFEELRQRMSEMPHPRDDNDVERMDHAETTHDSEATPTNLNVTQMIGRRGRQSNIERQLLSFAQSNYTIDAAVVIEDSTQESSRQVVYKAAKVKFDTASDVDLVSRQYLLRIGSPMDKLIPITTDNQAVVHGINNARFTPKFEVELQWSRRGDTRTTSSRFMVVDEAPFELLVESRRFLDGLRLSSLPLFRPRKSKDTIDKEIQEEKKLIEAAKALEEEEYQREMMTRRNMEPGRVDTIKTMAEVSNGDGAV